MEQINKICFYKSENKQYFGKIHIKYMIYFAFVIMAVTQLYISIWYLTYQVWWWFIALFTCIAALGALAFAIWKQNILILKGVLVYQGLFSILFFAASIWLLVLLCNPYTYSFVFAHCFKNWKKTANYCVTQVRIDTAVYFPIYFVAGIVNLYCLGIVYNFMEFLEKPILPSYNPQMSPTVARPGASSPQTNSRSNDDYLPTE